ncbi:MAG: ParA family protein [Chloroflexota bacterium]
MGETIAIANQKGGVGKTPTVISLGTWLALGGKRVLIVDLDPQANATSGLGIDPKALPASIYHGLVDGRPAAELILPTSVPGCALLPSHPDLAGAEIELVRERGRERRLAAVLGPVAHDYDFLLVDCPPTLSLLTVNGLTAAGSVLIPLQCEFFALEGLSQILETIDLVRSHLNPDLHLRGVLLTMADARTTLSGAVADEVRGKLGAQVFTTVIPRNVRLAEAPSHGLPIATYRPASPGGQAYAALAAELLGHDVGARSAVAVR